MASFPSASIHSELPPGVPNSPISSVGMDFLTEKVTNSLGEVNVTQCRNGRAFLPAPVSDREVDKQTRIKWF